MVGTICDSHCTLNVTTIETTGAGLRTNCCLRLTIHTHELSDLLQLTFYVIICVLQLLKWRVTQTSQIIYVISASALI